MLKILTHSIKITGLKATLTTNNKKQKIEESASEDESRGKTLLCTYDSKDIQESSVVHVNVSTFLLELII